MQQISGLLNSAIEADTVWTKPKAYLHLSNNKTGKPVCSTNPPTLNQTKAIIDGDYNVSMRIAAADYGIPLDGDSRLVPDDMDIAPFPWISDQTSTQAGVFTAPIEVTVEYPQTVTTNKIVIVSERFYSGQIKDVDIYLKNTSDTWIKVASHFQPTWYQTEVWLQNDSPFQLGSWSPTLSTSYTASIKGVRIVVYQVTVDATLPLAERPRRLHLYELDAALQVDASNDIISCDVSKRRDISSSTVSVIGGAQAAEATLILANDDEKYNNQHDSSPYKGMLDINTKIDIFSGFKLSDDTYEYVRQGTYYADSWVVDQDTSSVTVSARDYSKYMQERIMPPSLYEGKTIQYVVRDAAELAGVESLDIQDSTLTLEDLATGGTYLIAGTDDIELIEKSNAIWSNEVSFWEFLLRVAATDLGAFWFDESGKFIYRTKEGLSSSDNPTFVVNAHMDESNQIVSSSLSSELSANAFVIDYQVPKRSDTTMGIWEAESPQTLSATALARNISASEIAIPVGDISDWPKQGWISIEGEIIRYNSRTETSFEECERAQMGTAAAEHQADNTLRWTPNRHQWIVEGGVLKVTGSTALWGFANSQNQFAPNFSWEGKFKIGLTAAPYKVGLKFKADGDGNYYYFVAKTVGEVVGQGTTDSKYYELRKRQSNGTDTLLKDAKKLKIATDEWHDFKIVVNNDEYKLFVDGTLMITHTDSSFAGSGYIGPGSFGNGPLYFDNFTVKSLPDALQGERILLTERFGKPIFEVRKFEAEHAGAPAKGINYWMTNGEAEVIRFDPGPFRSELWVRNLKDGITIIEGARPEQDLEGLSEYLILYGNILEFEQGQQLKHEDKESIRKLGRKEVSIQFEWVQSRTHAKALLDYLLQVYKLPVKFINTQIYCLPHLQVGDLARVSYDRLGVYHEDFHVTEINISMGEEGFSQNLVLRSKTGTTFIPEEIPTITSFTPTSGPIGTSVTITGTRYNYVSSVSFNGVNAAFVVNSPTSITSIVPAGAATGRIVITTNGGTATSSTNFTVTGSPPPAPAITSFTPLSGPIGTSVTVTGTNFSGTTSVTVNLIEAQYRVQSDTQLILTVPTEATTGKIRVTTSTGTGVSAADFTVTTTSPPVGSIIRRVHSTKGSNSGNTPYIEVVPPSVTPGHVVLIGIMIREGAAATTFTEPIPPNANFRFVRRDKHGTVWTKTVEANEPTWRFNFSPSANKNAQYIAIAYENVNNTTHVLSGQHDGSIRDASHGGDSATITAPGVTTTVDKSMAVAFWYAHPTAAPITPDTSMNTIAVFKLATASAVADLLISPAGATGDKVGTGSASTANFAHMVVLNPAQTQNNSDSTPPSEPFTCPVAEPGPDFWLTSVSWSNSMPYPGYTETRYNRNDSPIVSSGANIPAILWRPSATAGASQTGGIMAPSSTPASGKFKTIVWSADGWSGSATTIQGYQDIVFLQKIVRMGYNVLLVMPRGYGGYGQDWIDLASFMHVEVDDLKEAVDWIKTQTTFVYADNVALMGHGRGGMNALVASHLYPDAASVFGCFAGSPNIACDIGNWGPDKATIKNLIQIKFGGSPNEVYANYRNKMPVTNVDAITAKTLLVHGGVDTFYLVKYVYDYYQALTGAGKTVKVVAGEKFDHDITSHTNYTDANLTLSNTKWKVIMKWLMENL